MSKSVVIFLCSYLLLAIFSCKPKSSLEDLALKISKSQNFKEYILTTKKVLDNVKKIYADSSISQKVNKMDQQHRKDTIDKLMMQSTSYKEDLLKLKSGSEKLHIDFPELNKLSKEEKQKVFSKASALVFANEPIK